MGSINPNFKKIDNLLCNMKDIVWIEIGVFEGENAEYVLRNYDIKKMYLIDPYKPLPYLKKYFGTEELVGSAKKKAYSRLEPFKDKIVFLEDFSENVCDKIPDNSCSLLFIDGNHSYESVLKDLKNFVPKVKNGGLIIGDDFNEEGVEKAIVEYAEVNRIDYEVEQVAGRTSKFIFERMIDISDIEDLTLYPQQGLSKFHIYSGVYNNEQVVVKMEDGPTSSNERFSQEKYILELGIPNVVSYFGHGVKPTGERFLVLERLSPLLIDEDTIQAIANVIAITSRRIYLHGLHWTINKNHVMQDVNGNVKLIDFNDVNIDGGFPIDDHYHDFRVLIKTLCDKLCVDGDTIVKNSINHLVTEEYQSLENVHESIYFSDYSHIQKRITERNDPNYGALRDANRGCKDRAQMIIKGIGNYPGSSVLDIGSNLGWFCFHLNELGYKTKGVDFDKNFWEPNRGLGWPEADAGKIKFCQMLSEIKNINVEFENADVNKEYLEKMPSYDIIMALSILHLYFSQHKISKGCWIELFKIMAAKTKKIFIFEVSDLILPYLNLKNQNELVSMAKLWGDFSEVSIYGISDAKRPVVVCRKDSR